MKKNKKDKYISDKIRELIAENKPHDQAVAIALSMANEKFKCGGTKYQDGGEQGLLPTENDKINSFYRPISYVQKGVTDAKGGQGVYVWYKKPTEKGFNIESDREFISNKYFDQVRQDPKMRNESLDAYFRKNPSQKFEDGGDYLPMYLLGGEDPPLKSVNPNTSPISYYNPGVNNKNTFDFTKSFNNTNTWLPGNITTSPEFGNVNFTTQKPKAEVSQKAVVNNNLLSPTASNTNEKELPTDYDQIYRSMSTEEEQLKNPDYNQMYMNMSLEDEQLKKQETPDSSFTQQDPIQFFNPYGGVDLNSAASIFGQSLQSGDALSGVASGAKLFTGLGRNFMGGFAAGKAREEAIADYEKNRRNAMTGVNQPVSYQEGGQMSSQDSIQEQILMMLQQGAAPEQILQQLVSAGVPQEQAIQAIQMVMQSAQQNAEAMPQEEVMMQEGGMFNQPEVPEQIANAEIEDGEYVRDGQGIKYAEGEKHSNGGIPTQLENGAQVLSDFKKVGKELAKQLSEQLGIKVRPTDTFASVLDKYDIKSGYKETQEEVEEKVKKISDQEKKVKNDATLALNKQVLSEEIEEEMQELSKMEGTRQQVFDLLFQSQEATKTQETKEANFMQDGGTIRDLMTKYNISEEDAKTLIPNYQGIFPSQYPQETADTEFARMKGRGYEQSNPYFFQNPGREGRLQDWVGSQMYKAEYELEDVKAKAERFKDLADNAGVPYTEADFKDSKSIDAFAGRLQKYIIENKPELAVDYGKKVEPTRQGLQYLVDNGLINPQEYGIKLVDGKVARGSYDTLSTEADKKLMSVISNLPQDKVKEYALTNYNDNLGYFRGIKTRDQEFTQEEYDNFISKNKPVGGGYYETEVPGVYVKPTILGQQPTTDTTQIPTVEAPTTPEQAIVADEEKKKGRLNMMLLPDQTPMQPWGMLPPAMTTQTIYAPKYNEIDPQEQLMEIQRNKLNTLQSIQNLPDSQQAASALALDANTNMATNKVMTETDRYNAMARERTEGAEAMQKTQQSQANIVGLQQYQQLLGQELEANEADWRNFYNRLNSNNMNNWMTINEVNRANAFNPNIQQTSNGFVVQNIVPKTLDASSLNLNFNDQKNKKKK